MYDILALSARYIFIFVSILIVLSILGIQKVQDDQRKRNQELYNLQNDKVQKLKLYIRNLKDDASPQWEFQLLDELTIGRGSENLVVLQDSSISKNHAVIFKKASKYYIQDLDSTNGTYLNGKKIKKAAKLDSSSVVLIGSFELRLAQQ